MPHPYISEMQEYSYKLGKSKKKGKVKKQNHLNCEAYSGNENN